MKGRIRHRLNIFRSKLDVNEDTFVNVSLSGDLKPLPPGEINHVLNVGKEFNNERQYSTIYRLIGTITPLFSNPLMNMRTTGLVPDKFGTSQSISENDLGLDVFDRDIFKKEPFSVQAIPPTLSFSEAFNKGLAENDGWFGFFDPDITKGGLCTFYDIEPTRKRFELGSYVNNNWKITITYPSSVDTTHITVNGGLLITGSEEVTVGGVPMVALTTATYHGLSNGDKVRLTNMSNIGYDGDFTVARLGLDNGDYQNNYFVINLNPNDVTLGVVSGRMKRLVNGQESEYYVREFEKLLDNDGNYEMYPLGFSNNVFNDKNYQFIINQDIDVYGLTDNLGRPLSELYLTIIKTDSNGMFHNVQSGLDLEFLPNNLTPPELSNVRKITYDPSTTHTPLESNILLSNSKFLGDIVEYNKFELIEKPLTDVLHRFNTKNREISFGNSVAMGPRREGYLYKPHHLIKIREFSLFIEQGDENTIGIPDYAENLGDGRYLWRDLLDIGVFDGGELLDYPFTNGAHYIHQNYCFMTMRQDPFSLYELYYQGDRFGNPFDPPDPIGDTITDKFEVKQSDDGC